MCCQSETFTSKIIAMATYHKYDRYAEARAFFKGAYSYNAIRFFIDDYCAEHQIISPTTGDAVFVDRIEGERAEYFFEALLDSWLVEHRRAKVEIVREAYNSLLEADEE